MMTSWLGTETWCVFQGDPVWAYHMELRFIWHCGTAQAPACSCHLLPPFTSMLIVFWLQDVRSSFGFDFVMFYASQDEHHHLSWWLSCHLLHTIDYFLPTCLSCSWCSFYDSDFFHCFLFFPSLFKWKEEYFYLSFMNKYVHYNKEQLCMAPLP